MKKISLSILILLMSSLITITWAQVDVTFQVDMSEVGANPDGVTVAGNFQDDVIGESYNDWAPGEIFLSEGDPGVYSVTVQLPAGTYAYKYVNGLAWGDDESVPGGCAVDGNRQLVVGTDPVELDLVCFGSCTVCSPPEVEVTFRVNMLDAGASPDGVFIAGSFQDPQWQAGDTEMTLESDAVYSYTTMLPVGEYYEYKFINGTSWENVPGGCNQNGNRYLTVPEGGISLDPVCFGSCVNCEAPEVEVTFQVDMNNETIDPNGVHIAGSFQDPVWQPGDSPMVDAGNGVFTFTASVPVGDFIEYKFINGNNWDFDETVPEECASGFNRFLNVPDHNVVLDPVCYGACGPCEGATDDLFFSEYYEGSFGNNKYVEVYNGTGVPVDFSQYRTHRISNGGDWDEYIYTYEEGTIIQPGDVFVIANDASMQEILDKADAFNGTAFFNGDDAVGLSKLVGDEWVMIDAIGEEGPDPGSGWNVAGVSNATKDHTLVRKSDVCAPNMDWASSAGTNADDSEWIVYPANTLDYLGFHNAVCGAGSPVVETPVFSVPSGTYFGAFSLEITCETTDATIYYTTDGSDPDQGSMEYTGPINVDMAMDVKAIAIATGYAASFVSSASYEVESVTEVDNLAQLRAMYPSDDYIKVTGEVILTFQQSFRNQKFIQDATAGVLIDDSPGTITTEYEIYDGITDMIGTVGEFGGMIQFNPAQDPGAPTSTGNVIVPEVITINDMNTNFEEYESELVQILGVNFNDAGDTFYNGNEYAISDGSKASAIFRATFWNVDYIFTTIPGGDVNVTGIPNSRSEGDFITARDLEDFEIPPFLTVTSPNGGEQVESGTTFDITWESNLEDGTLVDVYLYVNDGKSEELLAEDLLIETGMFTWNVTQPYGDDYKVKVMAADPALEDMSNDFFSIVPPIDIKITEIMYNSPEGGSDTLEFVEFYNNGEGALNLMDWEMTQGADFTFPEHILNPGDYVVVGESSDALLNTFGIVAYQWDGALGNGGEDIELTDAGGTVRAYVDYDDGGDWPNAADGYGPSLEFCDASLENNDPFNWTTSTKLAAINADGMGVYATPMAGCNEDPALPMYYSWGWTAISSYLAPEDATLETMFAPAGDLVILLNNQGIYWPGYNVNTIGSWDNYSGYKVKFDGGTYFVYSGTPVESQVYNYVPGTFFVPVLSDGPASVDTLIEPLGNDIEFIFDLENGAVYWPNGGIVPGVQGALETLEPGYAYLTKFTNSGTIDFGIEPSKAAPQQPVVINNTTSWNDVMTSGEQHIISIAETALEELETGDFIGAFNSEGACVGLTQFNGDRAALPMIVYGDDLTTEEVDGMVDGEMISFRIYRYGEELDATAVYNFNIQNHDGLFAENGLSMIDAFKLGATGIGDLNQAYSIYPNPGNGEFNIDVTGDFDVNVTNAQGQVIYVGKISGNSVINLSDQPEGIYFIRLTGDSSSLVEKVIVK